jgi:hypothetical protein
VHHPLSSAHILSDELSAEFIGAFAFVLLGAVAAAFAHHYFIEGPVNEERG